MKRLIFITSFIFITIMANSQTISLIGSATPANNWYIDFNMTQDLQNPLVWTINITLTDGEVKFRQDASWDVSWGGTDFPSGNAIPAGPNIPVTAGNYDVVLNTGEPFYEFILNTSYGNVGINNESPQEKLDVNGNIRFSGELKPNGVSGSDGQVLKSNGDGTMGWAEITNATSGPVGQNGSVGYGTWGGCDMINVSEYQPVMHVDAYSDAHFGISVGIHGDHAIAGAYRDTGPTGVKQGSATFYRWNQVNSLWEQNGAIMFDPDGQAFDYFGSSVCISDIYAAVGASEDNARAGSVTIYKYNSTTGFWELDGGKLFNSGAEPDDFFGCSVAISENFLIVGAYGDNGPIAVNQGSATIFKRNSQSGIWEFWQKLYNTNPAEGDFFGQSVSISGDYAIIGCGSDDEGYTNQGSVSIFKKNASEEWELQGSKITGYHEGGGFGSSVSISGDYAVVGAPYADLGYLTGLAYIFKRNQSNSQWEIKQTLRDQDLGDDYFGWSVNISGDYIISGTPWDEKESNSSEGSAMIFKNTGSFFQRIQKLYDPAAYGEDHLGWAVGIDAVSRRFIIGSEGFYLNYGKVVFGKVE